MRRLTTHSHLLKGAALGLLTFAIIASPFSVSLQSSAADVAYAQPAQAACSGLGMSLYQVSANVYSCQVTDGSGGFSTYYIDAQGNPTTLNGAASTVVSGTGQVASVDKSGNVTLAPTGCSTFLTYMASPFTCMFRTLVTYTAATLIYIASWILTLAGVLFNWLVQNTVVQFASVYTSNVQTAVETAWTAFRDIANILIIGIFTFVAISIILGLKEFGQKKMIARVLIIAVLINFSLLFTKMAIDASNFTAGQVYAAAALGAGNTQYNAIGTLSATNGTSNDGASVASAGIAGNFITLLGVQTFGATQSALDQIATAKDSGWIALLHGVFVFVILVGAAIVLFYGSFLLISRMIMLMFLMVTASIAFASYLIPKWETSRYGWDAWWSSLVWCATLAPMLMLLLWMTLNVAVAVNSRPGSGSFGDMIANPASVPDINTLVNYVIILGMLFASFKLSSKWASKIGGFNIASMVPGIGLGITGQLAGFLGRNTIGWGASKARSAMRGYYNRRDYDDDGNLVRDYRERQTGVRGVLNRAALRSTIGLGSSTFNPLQSKSLAGVASALGIPKTLTGKKPGEGGFEGTMGRKAETADELARKIGPTGAQSEQRQRAAETEGRRRFREQKRQTDELIHGQDATRATIEQQAKQAQPERAGAEAALDNERKTQAATQEDHASKLRIQEQRAANASNPSDRQAAQEEAARLLATRRQAMQSEAARIQTAKEAVDQLDNAAKQTANAHPDVLAFNAAIKEATDKLNKLGGSEENAGTNLSKKTTSEEDRALRKALLWDKRAAPKIDDAIKAHQNKQNWKNFRATDPDKGHGGGGQAPPAAPAAPAAPSSPPPAH